MLWLRLLASQDVAAARQRSMPLSTAKRSIVESSFFLLVGTGAITLTGLVFVALSLNLRTIAIEATNRNRAINTLTGLALIFMRAHSF